RKIRLWHTGHGQIRWTDDGSGYRLPASLPPRPRRRHRRPLDAFDLAGAPCQSPRRGPIAGDKIVASSGARVLPRSANAMLRANAIAAMARGHGSRPTAFETPAAPTFHPA